MPNPAKAVVTPPKKTEEGLRERKRRQTRERISQAAMTLFLRQGFDATTVEQIAAAADVSKRGFFDYFPTKEDVVSAWQDEFGNALALAVAARPANEPLTVMAQEALISTITASINPQSLAIGKLIRDTPSLRARDQMKYARLEQKLGDVLRTRVKGKPNELRIHLLAMIVIGALRVASQMWTIEDMTKRNTAGDIRKIARTLWSELGAFGGRKTR